MILKGLESLTKVIDAVKYHEPIAYPLALIGASLKLDFLVHMLL